MSDSVLEAEMHEKLDLLIEGFDSFREQWGLPLHVKDFSGYMVSHPLLGEFTNTYLYHENPYCSYIKSYPEANDKCIVTSNELLMRKLIRTVSEVRRESSARELRSRRSSELARGFYGVCWCGVREYVYPVCHNGIVIGALLAGAFRADERKLRRCFNRLNTNFGLPATELRRCYDGATQPLDEHPGGFELQVALLANYLSMLAEYYIEYPLVSAFGEACCGKTHRHRIINRAIEYITKNLSSKITVSDMAVYCMCSKSTLNHLFSGVMGRTIPEFVSIQRINRAKYMIINSGLSIEQIGAQCGFSSSAYFSVVFKKLTEQTPTEYRERITGRNREDISGLI